MAMTMVPTSRLKQYDIVNGEGKDMGQVQNFMVDMGSGHIAYVVVSFGGTLGLSDKWFAMPFDALCWSAEHHKFTLDAPREMLEKAPTLDKNKWPDQYLEGDAGWLNDMYQFYGCKPYWPEEGTSSVNVGTMVKTGAPAPFSGIYRYVAHAGDGKGKVCSPTMAEREVAVSKGERLPPVRSCGEAASWKLVRAA